jgi:UTP--glucose-1-phosphate uridylyltransferase
MARKVGAIVLAGGMATRFGGVVKAVVPADGDRSFFRCKHDDARALAVAAGAPVPVLVMSSFATHDTLVEHIGGASNTSVFPQFVALRLTPEGELFRGDDGELSPYATGHGDLTFALRASGALARFRDAGGTTLLMSNVDNLGATLDPAVIGMHAELGGAITVETVRKIAGDKGGAPALLDGVPQIIEGFRFPPAFDQDSIEVFNTNTFVLDAAAIDRDFALPYYRVEKQVDGRTAIQFERLVGELTATLPTRFIEVPRTGEDARFLPVKDPDELERSRAAIADVLSSQRSLHG